MGGLPVFNPISSSRAPCADVLKLALVAIHKALDPAQAQLVSSVHDEILKFSLLKDEYGGVTAEKIVRQCTEHAAAQVFGDAVRFTVKVKSGQTWACKCQGVGSCPLR